MADARVLHRVAGESAKVSALSDLEFRVWVQYVLSADDFGVMPFGPHVLQADNASLRRRPARTIMAALDVVLSVKLVALFEHQGQRHVWQPDWQDWQGIRYPRATVRPAPGDEYLREATASTLELFSRHSSISRKLLRNVSETFRTPVRAGTRETLTLTQTQVPNPHPARELAESREAVMARFGRFWEAYPRKVGKGAAEGWWLKARPSESLTAEILAAVAVQSQSAQWRRDGGQFIPHPGTWLRQRRWEDSPEGIAKPAAMENTRSWKAECRELHGGACGNVHFHDAKMAEGVTS